MLFSPCSDHSRSADLFSEVAAEINLLQTTVRAVASQFRIFHSPTDSRRKWSPNPPTRYTLCSKFSLTHPLHSMSQKWMRSTPSFAPSVIAVHKGFASPAACAKSSVHMKFLVSLTWSEGIPSSARTMSTHRLNAFTRIKLAQGTISRRWRRALATVKAGVG